MDGFKLLKTTFENKKEIVGVNFNGNESYNSFIKEGETVFIIITKKKKIIIFINILLLFFFICLVKSAYEIPNGSEVQVYSKDFIVKPNIFVPFVAQYINNLDFVLDVKVTGKPTFVWVCLHRRFFQRYFCLFVVSFKGTVKERTPEKFVSNSSILQLPTTKVSINYIVLKYICIGVCM